MVNFQTRYLIAFLLIVIVAKPIVLHLLTQNQSRTGFLSDGDFFDVGIFGPLRNYLLSAQENFHNSADIWEKAEFTFGALIEAFTSIMQLYGQQTVFLGLIIIFIFNYRETIVLLLEGIGLDGLLSWLDGGSGRYHECDDACLEHELPELEPPKEKNISTKPQQLPPKTPKPLAPRPEGWLVYDEVFGVIPEEIQKRWEENDKKKPPKRTLSEPRTIPPVRSLCVTRACSEH